MHCDFIVHVKHSIFWLNRGFRENFDLYVPVFSKSTFKYLLSIKVDKKKTMALGASQQYVHVAKNGPIWKIRHIQIKIYLKTSTEPK